MQRTTLELMRSHVREIHQALTGQDLPDENTEASPEASPLSADGVIRLFSDLEAVARTLPNVSERVPPFSFAPPVDLLEDDKELWVEVALPGVEQEDLQISVQGSTLTLSGARAHSVDGPRFRHAEIARGPFRRVIHLPHAVTGEPKVQARAGLVQIRLVKATEAEPKPN